MSANVEDVIERSQRVIAKVSAELAIMLVKRRVSKAKCRNIVLLLEGVCADVKSVIPEE